MDTSTALNSTTLFLVNEHRQLKKIMEDIATPRKKRTVDHVDALSYNTTEISDLFQGPYRAWLSCLIDKYMILTKLKAHVTIKNDDNIHPYLHDSNFSIPAGIKTDQNSAAIDKMIMTLEKLCQTQYQQWQSQQENWQEQFSMLAMGCNLTLSTHEVDNFQHYETISELKEAFATQNTTAPKNKKPYYDFHDYYQMKVTLAIHSALTRQHMPHSIADIEQVYKNFKNYFKTIQQEAEKTLSSMQKEADSIMQ